MSNRPHLILTSMIGGSDAISLSMNFYLMKRMIYESVHNLELDYLLKTRIVKLILVVYGLN